MVRRGTRRAGVQGRRDDVRCDWRVDATPRVVTGRPWGKRQYGCSASRAAIDVGVLVPSGLQLCEQAR